MVFDGLLISLIVGFLRKGSLRGIAELKLRAGFVFPLLLLFQIALYFFQHQFLFLHNISGSLFIGVYLFGLYFLWLNRKQAGFLLIFFGVFLNFLVMAINGGRMPVSAEASLVLDPHYIDLLKNGVYAKHALLTESTRLAFLGDVIPITSPYPKSQVISIGDVFMNIGAFFFVQQLMVGYKKSNVSEPDFINKGGEVHG